MSLIVNYHDLIEMLDQSVAKYGDLMALDFQGKSLSYAELGAAVDEMAACLQAQGVKAGDHVGLCLPNTPYSVIGYFGILKAGGVVVNFNPLYTPYELTHQINDSQTHLMLTTDLKLITDKLFPLLDHSGLEKIILCPFDQILPPVKSVLFKLVKAKERTKKIDDPRIALLDDLKEKAKNHKVSRRVVAPNQLAVLQYTGGTTGLSKGAMLSHFNITHNVHQVLDRLDNIQLGQERFLCILPLFHIFAMTALMHLSIATGGRLYLMPRFELKPCLKMIDQHKITVFPGVPSLFNAIVSAPETKKHDLTSLRFCISGGAPLPITLRQQFKALTGVGLIEGYGLSETSPVLAVHPQTDHYREGSIGPALKDTKISIRNPESPYDEMKQGERGEICAAGPQIMLGYFNQQEATAKAIMDGWFHTGDIGYMDEDGYIYITDRLKDLILVNGFNVYPRNVEDALYKHEAVAEVIVIGIDDPQRGQAPKAFVKKKAGHQAVNADALKDFLKAYLSTIELPSQIEFRDQLPKTMIGKLSKKELVEEERAKKQS